MSPPPAPESPRPPVSPGLWVCRLLFTLALVLFGLSGFDGRLSLIPDEDGLFQPRERGISSPSSADLSRPPALSAKVLSPPALSAKALNPASPEAEQIPVFQLFRLLRLLPLSSLERLKASLAEDEGKTEGGAPGGDFSRSGRLKRYALKRAEAADVQTEFPGPEPPPPLKSYDPASAVSLARILSRVALVIASLGLLVMLVLTAVKIVKSRLRAKREGASEKKAEKKAEAKSPDLLKALKRVEKDAQALASEGRYREAVHLLLLDGIKEFVKKSGNPLPPPLTSRELSRYLSLSESEARAFGDLISRSEKCWFGLREAGEDDFRMARESFRKIAGQAPLGELS